MELLGPDDRRDLELGAAALGASRPAIAAYCDGVAAVLAKRARGLADRRAGRDRRRRPPGSVPGILEHAGLQLERRLRRHVNRRTGRRAGEIFEDVLVARVL